MFDDIIKPNKISKEQIKNIIRKARQCGLFYKEIMLRKEIDEITKNITDN